MLPELSWTLSLKTIISYISNYHSAISYYKAKFPNTILDIDLDKFTINPEKFSKNIYKFCKLNWRENVLNFYKRKDLFSKTLSSSQIRREINKNNQSKYEKYYFLLEKK